MDSDQRVTIRPFADYGIVELSQGAIRDFFQPGKAYRISPNKYPSGERLAMITIESVWFVMAGAGEFITPERIAFHTGEIVELSAGQYQLEVVGDQALEVVKVFRLPEAFWAKE